MKSKIGIMAFLILILQGCVPSLHALFTKDDLIEVAEILGHWENSDDEIWHFEKYSEKFINMMVEPQEVPDPKKAYFVTILTDGVEEEFIIHFLKLGKHIYADFYPVKNDPEMSGFFSLHLVSAHSFARVSFEDEQLVLGMMDNDELEDAISENRVRIKHEKTNQGIVLTASTEELQRFVTKYGDLKGSFDSGSLFTRTAAHGE